MAQAESVTPSVALSVGHLSVPARIGIAVALLVRGGGAFSIDRALEGPQK